MSEQIDDGGPAFAIPGGGCLAAGMSLRDYFAAAVIPSILSHLADIDMATCGAYFIADAMLAARKEKP